MGMLLLLISAFSQVTTGFRVVRSPQKKLLTPRAKPICDVSTVAETCAAFTEGFSEAVVTIKDIADSLSVAEESVSTFLHKLDLDASTLTCQDLCQKTAASLPADRLPPAAFVGCHMEGSKKVCDMDLSDEGLAELAQTASFQNRTGPFNEKPTLPVSRRASKTTEQKPPQPTFSDLQKDITHWFGIWTVLEDEAVSLESRAHGSSSAVVCGTTDPTGCSGIGGARNQKELNRLTQAYIVDTERKVRSGCNNLLRLWFGSDSGAFKNKALSNLRQIARILDNSYLVNWENYAGYYGWVNQGEKYQGKWVIHFAKAYFTDRNNYNRVGTMTHEATHHMGFGYPGSNDVYCEKRQCEDIKALAKRSPQRAQQNPDSWKFFIDNVVGGGQLAGGGTCRS